MSASDLDTICDVPEVAVVAVCDTPSLPQTPQGDVVPRFGKWPNTLVWLLCILVPYCEKLI